VKKHLNSVLPRFHWGMRLLLYNLLFPLAFVVYLPLFVWKLVRRGGFTHHFWERFGVYSPEQKTRLRGLERPVWVHAVSVGEVVAAASFIQRWRERQPGTPFVLSTTTTTGHATAGKKLPEDVRVIYCPLDFFFFVRRVLDLIQPRLLVIFEVELWPNLVWLTSKRRTPVVLANGRMSDRSARGYARHRWFFEPVFGQFSIFCMQSEADADRVRAVVGSTVPVYACNTVKFDQVPDVGGVDAATVLDEFFGRGERLVWVAASTHAGEEGLVLDVFLNLQKEFPALKLVLVPRHHERTSEVEKSLSTRAVRYRLLRPEASAEGGCETVDCLLVNTTGELMKFCAVADVVFVGKSLAGNEGGHNIIEPAIFGKAILHGSAMQNFRLVVDIFREAHAAVQVESDDGLEPAVRGLLADPSQRRELGERARGVVDASRGAIDRTIDLLLALLQ